MDLKALIFYNYKLYSFNRSESLLLDPSTEAAIQVNPLKWKPSYGPQNYNLKSISIKRSDY
jgi:hypothetical protein